MHRQLDDREGLQQQRDWNPDLRVARQRREREPVGERVIGSDRHIPGHHPLRHPERGGPLQLAVLRHHQWPRRNDQRALHVQGAGGALHAGMRRRCDRGRNCSRDHCARPGGEGIGHGRCDRRPKAGEGPEGHGHAYRFGREIDRPGENRDHRRRVAGDQGAGHSTGRDSDSRRGSPAKSGHRASGRCDADGGLGRPGGADEHRLRSGVPVRRLLPERREDRRDRRDRHSIRLDRAGPIGRAPGRRHRRGEPAAPPRL